MKTIPGVLLIEAEILSDDRCVGQGDVECLRRFVDGRGDHAVVAGRTGRLMAFCESHQVVNVRIDEQDELAVGFADGRSGADDLFRSIKYRRDESPAFVA